MQNAQALSRNQDSPDCKATVGANVVQRSSDELEMNVHGRPNISPPFPVELELLLCIVHPGRSS